MNIKDIIQAIQQDSQYNHTTITKLSQLINDVGFITDYTDEEFKNRIINLIDTDK